MNDSERNAYGLIVGQLFQELEVPLVNGNVVKLIQVHISFPWKGSKRI
jgi:hypothetical protein